MKKQKIGKQGIIELFEYVVLCSIETINKVGEADFKDLHKLVLDRTGQPINEKALLLSINKLIKENCIKYTAIKGKRYYSLGRNAYDRMNKTKATLKRNHPAQ